MNALEFVAERSPPVGRLLAKPATRQLFRYAFAGLCVTQFAAAVYSALVMFLHTDALMANLLSTVCGLCAGYLVHSRWSFAEAASASERWQVGRFLLASLFAFLINSMWVWLLVTMSRLPPLAPVPLMILVTPWISFLLNRHWVFKAA
jgi:putative flippase GtrA